MLLSTTVHLHANDSIVYFFRIWNEGKIYVYLAGMSIYRGYHTAVRRYYFLIDNAKNELYFNELRHII